MLPILTERLRVRPWQPAVDAASALMMYSDPEVVRYIGGRVVVDRDEMATLLEKHVARLAPGEVYAAVEECDTGEVVGAAILGRIPLSEGLLSDDVQVGWHLRRDRWGRGYATELGRWLIARGFHGLDEIQCLIIAENTASIRVAERLNLLHVGPTTKYYDGLLLERYVARR